MQKPASERERTARRFTEPLRPASRCLLAFALFACSASPTGTPTDEVGTESQAIQTGPSRPYPEIDVCVSQLLNPTVHCGDVTINGQSDANLYAGVRTIKGNLTILAGNVKLTTVTGVDYYQTGVTFSLPDLRRVTGKVNIDTDRAETVSLPQLSRVGKNLNVTMRYFVAATSATATAHVATSTLDTAALTEVLGSVALTGDAGPVSGYKNYDFGLNQVTRVGGGVTLVNAPNGRVKALSSLTNVPGNLSVSWPGALDLNAPDFLPAVTAIGGSVSVRTISYTQSFMPEVTNIGGSFTIENYQYPASTTAQARVRGGFFPKLAEVGGDLTWRQAGPNDCLTPQLGALGLVRGTVRLLGMEMRGRIGKTGPNGLVAGSIEISGSQGVVPFFPDLRLAPGAAVDVHDNPNLCPCTLSTLQSDLTAAGWSGTISSSNNNPSCTSCTHC